MTDQELADRIQRGSKDALGMVIEKYYDDIYRFCRFYTGLDVDSYDITQEVFLKFIKYAGSYRHRNLKGYLLTIARNLCLDFFRKKKDTPGILEDFDQGEEDQTLRKAEDRLFFQGILQNLPVEQREVVILRVYEEWKFKEIAQVQGCSTATVKSRYKLGIDRIRKELGCGPEESGKGSKGNLIGT